MRYYLLVLVLLLTTITMMAGCTVNSNQDTTAPLTTSEPITVQTVKEVQNINPVTIPSTINEDNGFTASIGELNVLK